MRRIGRHADCIVGIWVFGLFLAILMVGILTATYKEDYELIQENSETKETSCVIRAFETDTVKCCETHQCHCTSDIVSYPQCDSRNTQGPCEDGICTLYIREKSRPGTQVCYRECGECNRLHISYVALADNRTHNRTIECGLHYPECFSKILDSIEHRDLPATLRCWYRTLEPHSFFFSRPSDPNKIGVGFMFFFWALLSAYAAHILLIGIHAWGWDYSRDRWICCNRNTAIPGFGWVVYH